MPLKFAEEPEKAEKPESCSPKATRLKEPGAVRVSEAKASVQTIESKLEKPKTKKPREKKTQRHHIKTTSSYNFAHLTLTIVEARNLACKKGATPRCKISLGTTTFHTTIAKKGGNTPVWNESFESTVDRDDFIQVRIVDQKKIAKAFESKDVLPMGKKKLPVANLARKDGEVDTWWSLVGGGELHVILNFKLNIPEVNVVHTKCFNYMTWGIDKYGVNVEEADLDRGKVAVRALSRKVIKWVRTQKAIMNVLGQDDEEEDEEDKEEAIEVPDNMEFRLIDISGCSHNRAMQMVVTFHWVEKAVKKESDDDDYDIPIPKILYVKHFDINTKLGKKRIHHYKSMRTDEYFADFNAVTEGMNEIVQEALNFTCAHEIRDVCHLIPITTDISHHVVLFFYKTPGSGSH